MSAFTFRRARYYLLILGCAILTVAPARGQTKPGQQAQVDDVVRVNTELVQTDVMVFDKKGQFVDGLKAEQFALKIDNKPQPISFFERVASGSLREEKKAEPNTGTSLANPSTSAPGRTLIFFIDDLHLSPGSLVRTRKALLEFIDHGMGQKDLAAITSPSGQIGFLNSLLMTGSPCALPSPASTIARTRKPTWKTRRCRNTSRQRSGKVTKARSIFTSPR